MDCLFELTRVFQWGCLKFKNASIMAMHVHALPTVDQDVKDPCARIQVMLQLITYHNISHYSHPQSHSLVFHCFLYRVDSEIISAVFNSSHSVRKLAATFSLRMLFVQWRTWDCCMAYKFVPKFDSHVSIFRVFCCFTNFRMFSFSSLGLNTKHEHGASRKGYLGFATSPCRGSILPHLLCM